MEDQILVFSLNLLNPLGIGEAHDSWVDGGVFWPVYVGGSYGENRVFEDASNSFS